MRNLLVLALVGSLVASGPRLPHAPPPAGALPAGPALPTGKIWIGDGAISTGTYDGPSHAPFLAALQGGGLAAGGQIEVLPGTYVFAATVPVPQAGVRIYGTKGAVLRLGPGFAGPLFHVTGAGFMLEGLTLEASDVAASTLVLVEAPGPSVLGCAIGLNSAGNGGFALDFLDTGAPFLTGALVQGNSFSFAESAGGWGGLRIRQHRSTRVIGNRFVPAADVQQANVLGAIDIHAGEWTTLEGNTFAGLSAPLLTDEDALVDCHRTTEGEGSHLAINANTFHDVAGYAILRVKGNGFTAIEGNAFQRLESPGGVVRLLEGTSDIVHANRFVEASPEGLGQPSVVVAGGRGTVVSACTFLECSGTQVVCESNPASGGVFSKVTLSGNWFEASGTATGGFPAIQLNSAHPVAAVGNTARGTSLWTAVFAPSTGGAADIDVGNNLF